MSLSKHLCLCKSKYIIEWNIVVCEYKLTIEQSGYQCACSLSIQALDVRPTSMIASTTLVSTASVLTRSMITSAIVRPLTMAKTVSSNWTRVAQTHAKTLRSVCLRIATILSTNATAQLVLLVSKDDFRMILIIMMMIELLLSNFKSQVFCFLLIKQTFIKG